MCSLNPQKPHLEWVISWPGQVVIVGSQVFWTAEVSKAVEQGDLANHLYPKLQTQVCTLRLPELKPTNFKLITNVFVKFQIQILKCIAHICN